MSKKKVFFGVGSIFAVLLLIGVFLVYEKNRPKELAERADELPDVNVEEVEKAQARLDESCDMAEIIAKADTTERVIAVTLDGMTDTESMKRIVEILEQYQIQAAFFPEGILAAEDEETVKDIYDAGFEIGNYTLAGEKHLEEKDEKELVKDFVKTSQVIEGITGERPSILKCNVTEYTDAVRQCAWASDIENIVQSDVMLSASSFASYDAAEGYVSSIEPGSVVSIKLGEELDEEEYEPYEQGNENPAEDFEAGVEITDTEAAKEETDAEDTDIVTTIEYFAQAVSCLGYETIFVRDLPEYNGLVADYQGKETALGDEAAKVYKIIPNGKNYIALTFRGIENEEHLNEVLAVLEKEGAKATFFVTGIDTRKYPERIAQIEKAGHAIENAGDSGSVAADVEFAEIYDEIERGIEALRDNCETESRFYMPRYGKYDMVTRKAAASLGCSILTYSKNPILDKEKTVEEIMEYFGKGLAAGDIIYFDLDYYEKVAEVVEEVLKLAKDSRFIAETAGELARYETAAPKAGKASVKTTTSVTPVIITGTTAAVSTQSAETSSARGGNTESQENEAAKIKKKVKKLRKENAGKLAEEKKDIHIVRDAVVFEFYGISNKKVLNAVLKELKNMKATATFYVDENDIEKYPSRIQKIKEAGHEVGLAVKPYANDTFETIAARLYTAKKSLKKSCGIESHLVFQPWGSISDITREAVSSFGMTLAGYDTAVVRSEQQKESSPQKVLDALFGKENVSLRQGQIIYFRMDYYTDDSLLARVMNLLKKKKMDNILYQPEAKLATDLTVYDGFDIVGMEDLLESEGQYEYPMPKGKIADSVRDAIYSRQLSEEEMTGKIVTGYIGTPSAQSVESLPGFSEEEVALLDKSGVIHTAGNEIFLTFDDWGSDAAINKLLYILEKHKVKATFFIRTANVKDNPNLLRKIACAGHTLASHTNEHRTLANRNDATGIFSELSKEELGAFRKDILTSYQELQVVAGDIAANGYPAVTTWFRPPTLAVGKNAMQVVFDSGYSYIISGNLSSHDYEAKSAAELYQTLKANLVDEGGNLKKGSLLVMHMSDEAKYTAEALDLLLTENEKKGSGDPSKFIVGNLADYLLAGSYQQMTYEAGKAVIMDPDGEIENLKEAEEIEVKSSINMGVSGKYELDNKKSAETEPERN